jgi:hypothetical protein
MTSLFAFIKRLVQMFVPVKVRTWQLEAFFVAVVLSMVAVVSHKGRIEWLGVCAVFFTWMHASVSDRLQEAQERRQAAQAPIEVECYRWGIRYYYLKEVFWFAYFIVLGAWSALAGTVLFLVYPRWRKAWRNRKK